MDELNAARFDQRVHGKIELAGGAEYSYGVSMQSLSLVTRSVAATGAAIGTTVEARRLPGSVARFEVAVSGQQTLLNLVADSKLEAVG